MKICQIFVNKIDFLKSFNLYFCFLGVPLYRHIADLAGVKDVVMPVPALNIINGGIYFAK